MKKKPERKIWSSIPIWFFIIFCIFAACYAIVGTIAVPYDAEKPVKNDLTSPLVWSLADGSTQVDMPFAPGTKAGEVSTIVSMIPNDAGENTVICMRADQEDVKVYVDDNLRIDYSTADTRFFGKASPRRYLFMTIHRGDAGAKIRIELTGGISGAGNINVLYYGDKAEIINTMVQKNAAEIAVAVFMLVISLLCFVTSIFLRFYYKLEIEMLHLTLVGIIASVWILCNSDISQFFFTNVSIAMDIIYFMLMLLPFPFMFFVNSLQKGRFKMIYRGFEYAAMAGMLFSVCMHMTGISDFSQLFPVNAAVLGSSLIMIVVTMIVDIRKNKNRNYSVIVFGMLVALVSTIIQFALFAIGSYSMGGNAVAVALLCMLGSTIIYTIRTIRSVEAERSLAVAEGKAEASFLANMSHEIRTPINAVLGMNEMILRETGESQTREYARNIENSGTMLLSIINDILDFSKIRSGKMDILPDKYKLSLAVEDIDRMIRPRAEGKNLIFRISFADDVPENLVGDVVRIKQILINLLSNSVKYTEKGVIKCTITKRDLEDGRIMLRAEVADTGRGIKAEEQATLFDAFTRADAKNNRNIEGTGLGLALVQKLAVAMGGDVSVESTYGVGSVFAVEFPQEKAGEELAKDAIGKKKEETAPIEKKSGLFTAPDAKVLVVDDNSMNLKVVTGLLKRTKVQVTGVLSGTEALEVLKTQVFDLILLDHLMPVMDGEETLHKIKEQHLAEGTPIIVLTANAIAGAKESYLEMGFDDYLSKPVKPVDLETMLMNCIPAEKVVRI